MATQTKTTWRRVKMGDIADVQWGDTNTTKAAYKPTGFLAFSATGADGFMDHYDFDRDGIVLSAIGANCGETWFTYGKWSAIKNTIVFWAKPGKSDTKFLFYKTHNKKLWPIRGSAQPFISQGDAREMELLIPENPANQKRIADILSAFDDKIELNNKISAALEQMAQAIFKEWFVNFRFPGHEKVKMVDSELGKIPEGWKASTVGKVCDSITDGDWIETKDQGGHDYRLLQVSNIGVGSFVETGNFRFINKEAFERLRCTEIRPGDILVARMPKPTGRAWLVTEMPWRMITAVDIAIVKTNPSRIRKNLLAHYFNSPANLDSVEMLTTGSTRSRLTRRDLAALPIVVPPLSLQDKWETFANDAYIKITNLRKENQKLAALRDLLLPKLMSGKIRV